MGIRIGGTHIKDAPYAVNKDSHEENAKKEMTKASKALDEPTYEVELGGARRDIGNGIRAYGKNGGPLDISAVDFDFSAEARAERAARNIAAHAALDPYEGSIALGVQYEYAEGTLGGFIQDKLGGIAEHASIVANELSNMIRAKVNDTGGTTMEERAVTRETGMALARRIAEEYMSDADATEFMRGIQKFYDNEIMREKGYIRFDDSDASSILETPPDTEKLKAEKAIDDMMRTIGAGLDKDDLETVWERLMKAF